MVKHNFKNSILALGAESKGVFALADKKSLIMSRAFGSLLDYGNFSRYEAAARRALRRLGTGPDIVACDMHPGYNSTLLGERIKPGRAELIKVQHHYAHIASCMLDNGIGVGFAVKVIGVAFDGTGYGADGNMWGGEFLVCSGGGFKREAHLKYLPMPGGDKAVLEPWRMAAVYLRDAFGDGFTDLDIPFTKKIKKGDWRTLRCAVDKRINAPLTSSAGRLFDAASAVITGVLRVKGEAEAALKLQKLAQRAEGEKGMYGKKIAKNNAGFIVDFKGMFAGIVDDIKNKKDPAIIAARFHNTLACAVSKVCAKIRKNTNIAKVALSGGVFQNGVLREKTRRMLEDSGFEVYTHRRIPAGDAGIAAGQIAVAANKV